MMTVGQAMQMHEDAIEIQRLEDDLHKKLAEFAKNHPAIAPEVLRYRDKAETLYMSEHGFDAIFLKTEKAYRNAAEVQNKYIASAKIEAGKQPVLLDLAA